MKRRRSRSPAYFHQPTGANYQLIGARECQAGKTFVCTQHGDLRERLFLVEGFDIPFVERESLWLQLHKVETARTKADLLRQKAQEKRLRVAYDDDDEPIEEDTDSEPQEVEEEFEAEAELTED